MFRMTVSAQSTWNKPVKFLKTRICRYYRCVMLVVNLLKYKPTYPAVSNQHLRQNIIQGSQQQHPQKHHWVARPLKPAICYTFSWIQFSNFHFKVFTHVACAGTYILHHILHFKPFSSHKTRPFRPLDLRITPTFNHQNKILRSRFSIYR